MSEKNTAEQTIRDMMEAPAEGLSELVESLGGLVLAIRDGLKGDNAAAQQEALAAAESMKARITDALNQIGLNEDEIESLTNENMTASEQDLIDKAKGILNNIKKGT
jgi:hypothetical protein